MFGVYGFLNRFEIGSGIFHFPGVTRREKEEEILNAMLMYSERKEKQKHLRFINVIT